MPAFFIYLLKVNIALLLFYMVYRVVLRRLTFYTANRWYLLFAITCSTLFPFINLQHVPEQLPAQPAAVFNYAPDWNFVHVAVQNRPASVSLWSVAYALYWTGVLAMTVFFVKGLIALWRVYRSATRQPRKGLYYSKLDIAPFSFWNMIFINPDKHDHTELAAILQHEMVHVQERHGFDLLLGDLNRIFYWFNPGAWLMKGAIRENLEFIADATVLQSGIDARAYQYQLLHTATGFPGPGTMTNGFAFKQLKKRICMMNKTKSGRRQLLRYLLLLPLLAVVLVVFTGYSTKRRVPATRAANKLKEAAPQKITYACIVADANGCKPLAGVRVEDESGNLLAVTGSDGYFKVLVPNSYTNGDVGVSVKLSKPGFRSTGAGGAIHGKAAAGRQALVGYAEMCRTADQGKVQPQTAFLLNPNQLRPEWITCKTVQDFYAAHIREGHAAPEAGQTAATDEVNGGTGEAYAFSATLVYLQNDPVEKKQPGPVNGGKPLLIWNGREVAAFPGEGKQFLEARLHVLTLADGIVIYGNRAKDGVYELTTFDKPDPQALVYNNLPDAWYFRLSDPGPDRSYLETRRVEYNDWLQLPEAEKAVMDLAGELKGRETLFIGIDNVLVVKGYGQAFVKFRLKPQPGSSVMSLVESGSNQFVVRTASEGKASFLVTGITKEGIETELGIRTFEVKLLAPAKPFNREKHSHLIRPAAPVLNAGHTAPVMPRTDEVAAFAAGREEPVLEFSGFYFGFVNSGAYVAEKNRVAYAIVDDRLYTVAEANRLFKRHMFDAAGVMSASQTLKQFGKAVPAFMFLRSSQPIEHYKRNLYTTVSSR